MWNWTIVKAVPSANRGFTELHVEWAQDFVELRAKSGVNGLPVADKEGNVSLFEDARRVVALVQMVDVPEDADDATVRVLIESRRGEAMRHIEAVYPDPEKVRSISPFVGMRGGEG